MVFIKQSNLPKETIDRLLFIANLKKGWLDGEQGVSISKRALMISIAFLEESNKHKRFHRPGIYPLIEGGVSLEWDNDSQRSNCVFPEWDLEIRNNGDMLFYAPGLHNNKEDIEMRYYYNNNHTKEVIRKILQTIHHN